MHLPQPFNSDVRNSVTGYVALTREGPLDVYLTFGTSDGGVYAQVGACLAPVSGAG